MRANRRWDLALRPRGAYGAHAMYRPIASGVEHRAMMLAMATATSRKAGIRVLREGEHRRNQRKREGGEQQNGEQASHGSSDASSVRPHSNERRRMFPVVPASGRVPSYCGLS